MSKFKDASGDTWKLKITVATILKVNDDCDINISKFLDNNMELARDVMGDACKVVSILFCILEDQIDERELCSHSFAERLAGDVYKDAASALWQAFLDFCPSKQRDLLLTLDAKMEAAADEAIKDLEKANLKDLMSLEMRMKQQESAESIPIPTRHAN